MKKGIKALIIISAIILIIALAVLAFFIIKKTALSRAINGLDIENTDTAVRVMRLGDKDEKTVNLLANAYFDAGYKQEAALLSLYIIQYLDSENENAIETINKCYENALAKQFISAGIRPEKFKAVTDSAGFSYGISNGIYCEFLEGYAKAKISPALPLDIYASKDGVYYLDSTDNFIKFICKDGSGLTVAVDEKADEFVYHDGNIFYIDTNGAVHGDDSVTLADGEQAMDLRIESGEVFCTIYDENFEELRAQKLKAS